MFVFREIERVCMWRDRERECVCREIEIESVYVERYRDRESV